MKNRTYQFLKLNLQLFAGDGAGASSGAGDGGSATSAEGATTADNGGVATSNGVTADITGQQKTVAVSDRQAEFERLIKTDYKDLYDQKMQDTIQKRLKGTKEITDKYQALTPTLELLAKKYGVHDASDIDALNKAIEEDDSFYEDEALDRGISVEQLKQIKKMERENTELKRQMAEAETQKRASQIYAGWLDQAKSTQQAYPSFNLDAEMRNPQFVNLLKSNIDVKTAFEVIHKDEIIPAAMQYTAQTVQKQITNKIMSQGNRPTENGLTPTSASLTKSDVASLTREQRQELIKRAAMGERITF